MPAKDEQHDDPGSISFPIDLDSPLAPADTFDKEDPEDRAMTQPRSAFHRLLRPKPRRSNTLLPRAATMTSVPALAPSPTVASSTSKTAATTTTTTTAAAPARMQRTMSLRSAPPFGSRVPTCAHTLAAKAAVVMAHPALAITLPHDPASRAVSCGLNALRAEALDLAAMVAAMQAHSTRLSHTAVSRFFTWLPGFAEFMERCLQLENELLLRPLEDGTLCTALKRGATISKNIHKQQQKSGKRKSASGVVTASSPTTAAELVSSGPLPGDLRPRVRMRMRGELRRLLQDIIEAEGDFTPNVPAGQRLGDLSTLVNTWLGAFAAVVTATEEPLAAALRARTRSRDVDRLPLKMVRHLVAHTGYKEFLAVYTRWMPGAMLREWKATVLLPVDYKFFSYTAWERTVDSAHYSVAAGFWQGLADECDADGASKTAEQTRIDFERAKESRLAMAKLHAGETDSPNSNVDGDGDFGLSEDEASPAAKA